MLAMLITSDRQVDGSRRWPRRSPLICGHPRSPHPQSSASLMGAEGGVTLIEVLIAALVMGVVAGGMLITFLLVSRLSQGSAPVDRAGLLAQQTLERFRNRIACDDAWFDPATPACDATALPPANTDDPLPGGTGMSGRFYTITSSDCDGDGIAGDCFLMAAKITGVVQ